MKKDQKPKYEKIWWPWDFLLILGGIAFLLLGICPTILPLREGVSVSISQRIFFIILGLSLAIGIIAYHSHSKKVERASLFLIGAAFLSLGIWELISGKWTSALRGLIPALIIIIVLIIELRKPASKKAMRKK